MKFTLTSIFSFSLLLFTSVLICCTSKTDKKANQKVNSNVVLAGKYAVESLHEFLLKLKKDSVDTIINYKRTCINCCDFFNVFWSSKGQQFLCKFYDDVNDGKAHAETMKLNDDEIFKVLKSVYNELKQTSIKANMHMNKDGSYTDGMIDHYCYTQIEIYTQHDSIITGSMKDHDFDKYTEYYPSEDEKKETNDNYRENFESKWNILAVTIENELATMTKTSRRELETLRTRK